MRRDTEHRARVAHLDTLHRVILLYPIVGFLDDVSNLLDGDGPRSMADKLNGATDSVEHRLCTFELDVLVQLLIAGEIIGLRGRIESDCGIENGIV